VDVTIHFIEENKSLKLQKIFFSKVC